MATSSKFHLDLWRGLDMIVEQLHDDTLSAVFTVWSGTLCSPYLWKTILDVLVTDAVGHEGLAKEIAHRLSGEI